MRKSVLILYPDNNIYKNFFLDLLWVNFLLILGGQLGGAKSNSGDQWWWNIDEGLEKTIFLSLAVFINVRFIYNRWKKSYLIKIEVTVDKENCRYLLEVTYIHKFKRAMNTFMIDCNKREAVYVDCYGLTITINNKEYNILSRSDCQKIYRFIYDLMS